MEYIEINDSSLSVIKPFPNAHITSICRSLSRGLDFATFPKDLSASLYSADGMWISTLTFRLHF
jgi:hypothetical protein